MEFKNIREAVNYALDRSLEVKVSPAWRSFDPHSQRNNVVVEIFDDSGDVHWEGIVPVSG